MLCLGKTLQIIPALLSGYMKTTEFITVVQGQTAVFEQAVTDQRSLCMAEYSDVFSTSETLRRKWHEFQ